MNATVGILQNLIICGNSDYQCLFTLCFVDHAMLEFHAFVWILIPVHRPSYLCLEKHVSEPVFSVLK